jgi:hypothetical protein
MLTRNGTGGLKGGRKAYNERHNFDSFDKHILMKVGRISGMGHTAWEGQEVLAVFW